MAKSVGDGRLTSNVLKPGDVLFSRSNEPTSIGIQTLSRSLEPREVWSHVAIVIAPNIRFEAPGSGQRAGFHTRTIESLVQLPDGKYAARIHEGCNDLVILRKPEGSEDPQGDDPLGKFWGGVNGIRGLRYPRAPDWIRNFAVRLRHLALGRVSSDAERLTIFCSQAVYLILTTQHPELERSRARDILSPTDLFALLTNDQNNWKRVFTLNSSTVQEGVDIVEVPYGPLHKIGFETARLKLKLNDIQRQVGRFWRDMNLIGGVDFESAEYESQLPQSEQEFKAVGDNVFRWWEMLHELQPGASLDHLTTGPMMQAYLRGKPYSAELPDGSVFLEMPGRAR